MIEKLTEVAKCELDKGIECVDTKEMSEVCEMISDLAKAEYHSKISKAMDESEYGVDYDYMGAYDEYSRKGYRGQPRDSKGRYMSRRGRRMGYVEPIIYDMMPDMDWDDAEYHRDIDRKSLNRMYYNLNESSEIPNESNYEKARRVYEETKATHKDNSTESKQHKMRELENYLKELSLDVTSMLSDMSLEEKALMKQKMQTLMQKL